MVGVSVFNNVRIMDDVHVPQFIKPCLIHFKGDKIQYFDHIIPLKVTGMVLEPVPVAYAGKLPANSGLYVSVYGFGNMLVGSAR